MTIIFISLPIYCTTDLELESVWLGLKDVFHIIAERTWILSFFHNEETKIKRKTTKAFFTFTSLNSAVSR